jgi:Amt family ammonium transporter
MNILGPRLAFFRAVDDTLEIFHTHLVAGVTGGFLVGIFATAEGCAAFALTSPGGAIAGNGKQIGWQLAGALFIIGWNIVSASPCCLATARYMLTNCLGHYFPHHVLHQVRLPHPTPHDR